MKFLDVPMSGSLAGRTYSHNSFGQYCRQRAIPTNPNSERQSLVRSVFTEQVQTWRTLDAEAQAGWKALGGMLTRHDPLGQAYTLSGLQAFMFVNNSRVLMGDAALTEAPAIPAAVPVETMTITLEPDTFSVAFTPTPMPAGVKLMVFASPPRSPGRNYESDFRFIKASAAAGASPVDIFDEWAAKFGNPAVGDKVFVSLEAYNEGWRSAPLRAGVLVAAGA